MTPSLPVKDFVEVILAQALLQPTMPAVDQDGAVTSYGDLYALACQIGGAVRHAAPQVCPRVLVALPQSVSAYAGMLGVLMAGGTFCPVNLGGPIGRNATICESFSPHAVLFAGSAPAFLDALPATTPRIDVSRLKSEPLKEPVSHFSDVAYVVFTSGSTGQPKGVKLGRAGFSHFLGVASRYFPQSYGARWGQFSNLGYDLAVMDVFMALTQGRVLVPLARPTEQLRPAAAIAAKGITIWQSVPSVLELMRRADQLTPECLSPLRVMSFCGEPLLPQQLKVLFAAKPDLEVFNTFGATETMGFNTLNCLTAGNYEASCQAPSVALGDDVPGWQVNLLGGETSDEGEIVVSSDWLSHGYWTDELRTRDVFRQMRLADGTARQVYFTGDRGVRKGGRIYFQGRADRQVKIRGERIELDEIDHALREEGFAAAYTVFDGTDLHSFVEAAGGVDVELVRAALRHWVPFHAIPKSIRAMADLPRNPNGKIDRAALQAMVQA